MLWVLLIFVALIITFQACERDNILLEPVNKQNIKTVTKADAFYHLQNNITMNRSGTSFVTEIDDAVVYDSLINSDEMLATIAVQTQFEKAYSRILLLEINDTLQTVVYNMYSNNNFETVDFNGSAIITDLEGLVKNGFKIENGYYVAQYMFPENYTLLQTASRSGSDQDYVWDDGELDEIVLNGPSKNIKIMYVFYPHLTNADTNPESSTQEPTWTSGGGGSSNTTSCPTGYVKDDNNNCVPEPTFDPCAEIKQQLENANHQAKVNFLKTKTGDTIEHGFKQLKTGPFASLPTTNSGHSLDFGILTNAVGYIHTHTDLYYTGRYDDDNNPEYKEGIKMFSTYDLRTFLLLVKNAQQDSSINVGDIYGTVITSSGNYTLKFTGNPNLINTDFNPRDLNEDYEEYIDEFGKEKGFLKFIKEITNNNGVSLYEIKDNGTIKEKYLDENGNKQTENCD